MAVLFRFRGLCGIVIRLNTYTIHIRFLLRLFRGYVTIPLPTQGIIMSHKHRLTPIDKFRAKQNYRTFRLSHEAESAKQLEEIQQRQAQCRRNALRAIGGDTPENRAYLDGVLEEVKRIGGADYADKCIANNPNINKANGKLVTVPLVGLRELRSNNEQSTNGGW